MAFSDPLDLYKTAHAVWAADTASPPESWTSDNPAKNHCSITALIVQDHFGGDILKTQTSGGTHFYNLVNGKRWDLTMSQFAEPIGFEDTPSSRAEALSDTTPQKYQALSTRIRSLHE